MEDTKTPATKTKNLNVATSRTSHAANPNLLTIGLGVCCLLMGLALIGAFMNKDAPKGVATTPQPTTITNNNYHVNGQPSGQAPDLPNMPQVNPTTPVSTVAYAPQPRPNTVLLQASAEPVVQHKIVYVEQPRPDPVADTTIVIYKPEVRQPVQKIVVIDERYERLKSEHDARMKEWTSGPVVVVK